ncbi:hypothetical protein [Pontixanthobacter aquaemixtae]|uniref:Uncharacterized protein n=1 Tax=Pontixanthobacter aquaemixtae TaxID=1958940 RepID=A0A844ZVA5_9SPHN|nr:hypothetical protein [Pontixanthobacter aquaemixtae]MXO89469.1 hypothetical protein [Pontixanthobacter aquaemixtae]
MVRITPIDGWGYSETIDGRLARPFEAEILEEGVEFAADVIGWEARAVSGKYAGRLLKMTPRHVEWRQVIVLEVFASDDRSKMIFSGMANTTGLECNWK